MKKFVPSMIAQLSTYRLLFFRNLFSYYFLNFPRILNAHQFLNRGRRFTGSDVCEAESEVLDPEDFVQNSICKSSITLKILQHKVKFYYVVFILILLPQRCRNDFLKEVSKCRICQPPVLGFILRSSFDHKYDSSLNNVIVKRVSRFKKKIISQEWHI